MAVSKMLLLSAAGPVEQFDEAALACLINREFEPENILHSYGNVAGLRPFKNENPYRTLLSKAYEALEQEDIEPAYAPYEKLDMRLDEMESYLSRVSGECRAIEDERKRLDGLIRDNEQVVMQLGHLERVEAEFDDLFSMEFVKIRFGRMPTQIYKSFLTHIDNTDDVYFFPGSMEEDFVYGMYCMPVQMQAKADALFAGLHFERIRISERAHGTPMEAIESLQSDNDRLRAQRDALDAKAAGLQRGEHDRLLAAYSYIRSHHDAYELRRFAARTDDSFHVMGWIPVSEEAAMRKAFDTFSNISCTFEDPKLAGSDLTPPTKLENNRFTRPFEMFINMYGLPSYNEFDPSTVVALTFSLFYGIMFGDIGQGIVISLLGMLLWNKKGMQLGRVMTRIGIFSTLFGVVYGSVFGNEEVWHQWTGLPTFQVLHTAQNTNIALVGAVALGSVMVVMAMVMSIINGVKNRDLGRVLFSPNGVAGLLLYWSILLLILSMVGFDLVPGPLKVVLYVLGFAVPLAAIFLREPLGMLASRKKPHKPENLSGFIIENFVELFETLLTMLTNTISFVRLGAFAVSHAIMMLVVQTLAGLDSPNILIMIIGNLFVIGLEGLIVGIQCLRLEFYEMFSRFYGGSGRPFAPLLVDYSARIS